MGSLKPEDFFWAAKITKLESINHTSTKKNIEKTLKIEALALQCLADSVTDDMCYAVELIFKSPGRVVVCGIGKSAIVAQKIAATFNSTGTTAMFLHAADAIHGDLGMLQPGDVALCISKSGDTPEIKMLVPLIKNFGNKIISFICWCFRFFILLFRNIF